MLGQMSSLFGLGGTGAGAGEAARQGRQLYQTGFPIIEMVSNLIRDALSGNVGKFENRPMGQRKASVARKSGGQKQESTRRALAGKGLENTSAGQAELQNIGMDTDAMVFEALMSEMEQYTAMAPQFGMGVTGMGQQGTQLNAQLQQRAKANTEQFWQQIISQWIQSSHQLAGDMMGGGGMMGMGG